MKKNRLCIIGAGPAGLASAYYAHKVGLTFSLIEASSYAGGNCRTIKQGSFNFDTGAHRLHCVNGGLKDLYKELLGDDLVTVDSPSRIYNGRQFFNFPLMPADVFSKLGLIEILQSGGSYLKRRLIRSKGNNFAANSRNTYGDSIAQRFLLNYSEKLWGIKPDLLAPEVSGKRLKGLSFSTFILETLKGKSAAAKHIDGQFFYPRKGIGQLSDSILARLPSTSVLFNNPVTELHHSEGVITSIISSNGEAKDFGQVISSLPVTTLLKLLRPLPPDHIIEAASKLRFRNLALIHIPIKRESVSKDATIYFSDFDFVFTRVTEPRNRSVEMTPSGFTSLVAEVPYFKGDGISNLDDACLKQMVIDQLKSAGLIKQEEIAGESVVCRIPFAYPVLDLSYKRSFTILSDYLRTFKNLYSVGRSGSFSYTHIHDHFLEARNLVEGLRDVK